MAPEDTRRLVLESARAMLTGPRKPTVEDVAEASGVSRATIYRLFGTRNDLLAALDVERDPSTRARILDAALDLVGRDGLSRLSMNELATRAGVSRASLYRLFPGKPALFRELLKRYSPLEPVLETLEAMAGRPPVEVMPALARAIAEALGDRPGIVRAFLFDLSAQTPDSAEAASWAIGQAVGPVIQYVLGEMAAARLRPMHPLLALQSFIGPLLFHLITRDIAVQRLGLDVSLQDSFAQLAQLWVDAMRPEEGI